MPAMSKIHEQIRAWRERQEPRLSQDDAAKRVGVTRFTWLRWESGSPIELRFVAAVARETGIAASELRPDIAGTFMHPQTEAAQ
jgi:DNA-binding XRE family transcriptional regulator